MPARSPEEVNSLFAEALHAGDLDSLVALYEEAAILVPQPGQIATGKNEIRQALGGFIALKPTMKVEVYRVFQTGGIALTHSDWQGVPAANRKGQRSADCRPRGHEPEGLSI